MIARIHAWLVEDQDRWAAFWFAAGMVFGGAVIALLGVR